MKGVVTKARITRIGGCLIAFPPLVIALGLHMSTGATSAGSWQRSIAHAESVASTLTSLSMALLSVDVALMAAVGVVITLADRMKADIVDWALASITIVCAASSILCTYRFQIDLSSQLATDRIDFKLGLTSALEGAAILLLTAATTLIALAVDRFHRTASQGRKR